MLTVTNQKYLSVVTKKSGVGREHGSEAMLEYTQSKSITVGMGRFQSRFNLN